MQSNSQINQQIVKNKKYFIAPINSSKANQFTCYYHYSHTGFKKAKLNLGIFLNETNQLVAVQQWGCSAQEAIRLDRYVKESITTNEYYELNRFCMADSESRNSESQAISLGIKWIKKFHPHIRLLVSYSGRKEGNYGYIYQATNWEYLGYFVSNGFWRLDGQEVHQITVWYRYTHGEYSSLPFQEALDKMYHSIIRTWSKQLIYIQRLDKTLTPASPILPYPKVSSFAIIEKTKIYKDEPYEYIAPKIKKPRFQYNPKERLFSKQKLVRDGVLERKIPPSQFQVAQYDLYGHLVDVRIGMDSYEPYFLRNTIRKSSQLNKIYKDYLFKLYEPDEEEIPEEIDIPLLAIVDEIPFCNGAEMGRYLGVSRQAVSSAYYRQSKKIAGHDIIWFEQRAIIG